MNSTFVSISFRLELKEKYCEEIISICNILEPGLSTQKGKEKEKLIIYKKNPMPFFRFYKTPKVVEFIFVCKYKI